jgi:hypothetical protein
MRNKHPGCPGGQQSGMHRQNNFSKQSKDWSGGVKETTDVFVTHGLCIDVSIFVYCLSLSFCIEEGFILLLRSKC